MVADKVELELLRELVQLTRVSTYPVAREVLREVFFDRDEPQRKRVRVFANLDGRSQTEVAQAAGVSQSSVSSWSREWQRMGLVSDEGHAVFDIYDFFPDLKEKVDNGQGV